MISKKEIFQILEDNRNETTFALTSDNEAAEIAIEHFISAVKAEMESMPSLEDRNFFMCSHVKAGEWVRVNSRGYCSRPHKQPKLKY